MVEQPKPKSLEQRILERAERLWRADGAPKGQLDEYRERARELLAIEDNPGAGLLPNPAALHPEGPPPAEPIEEAELMENLGEFPGPLTDQGDTHPTPMVRKRARRVRNE